MNDRHVISCVELIEGKDWSSGVRNNWNTLDPLRGDRSCRVNCHVICDNTSKLYFWLISCFKEICSFDKDSAGAGDGSVLDDRHARIRLFEFALSRVRIGTDFSWCCRIYQNLDLRINWNADWVGSALNFTKSDC